jgi:hypothetical protein
VLFSCRSLESTSEQRTCLQLRGSVRLYALRRNGFPLLQVSASQLGKSLPHLPPLGRALQNEGNRYAGSMRTQLTVSNLIGTDGGSLFTFSGPGITGVTPSNLPSSGGLWLLLQGSPFGSAHPHCIVCTVPKQVRTLRSVTSRRQ